jgi:hypothetical protein
LIAVWLLPLHNYATTLKIREMKKSSLSLRYVFWTAVCVLSVVIPAPAASFKPRGATAVVPDIGMPVPPMDATHIPNGQRFLNYNSNPPTSGPHWGASVRCGIYTNGLPNELAVHNMEHGNVVISFSLKNQAEVDRLIGIAKKLPGWNQWGILRFYPNMDGAGVALTAWGVLDAMEGVDEARIQKFWDAYAANRLSDETLAFGPIPCS